MNESEDTLEVFEAKEAAYKDGFWTGILFGVPIGSVITGVLVWLIFQ